MNSSISFTSRITPVSSSKFNHVTSKIDKRYFADYPWTAETGVAGKSVYTKRICDCTGCIITDGEKALLLHITPHAKSNHNFSPIRELIRNTFNGRYETLNAVVAGSKDLNTRDSKKSQDIYEKFKALLAEYNIPSTFLKHGKDPVNIAYNAPADEVIVSALGIDKGIKKGLSPLEALKSFFKEVVISPQDKVPERFPDT